MTGEKRQRLFTWLWHRQNGCCAISGTVLNWGWAQVHHARVHDSRWARRRFPLFIDSIFNCVLVDPGAHQEHGGWGHWPIRKVEWYERRLAANPRMARWANREE